jgi:elongation factor P
MFQYLGYFKFRYLGILLTFAFHIKKLILMATTADMRNGLILKLDGNLYSVVEFGQNKTARAAAKVWAKLKGVDNNRSIEHTWNSGDNIFPVRVEKRNYQFLYKDDSGFNLMDNNTFEQIIINPSMIERPELYKDGQECFVVFNTETEVPMGVELPPSVTLMVTYSEPGVKGDTATRATKAATVETGATVMVPLFVNADELIKIDSKTGAYVERVKS